MQFCIPHVKKSPKSPTKNNLSAVWSDLSGRSFCNHPCLYYSLVQHASKCVCGLFYKKSAPNDSIWGFCDLSQEFHKLAKVIASRLSANFTFSAMLKRISEWQFLMVFCYTELLFPRNSESDRTLLSSRPTRKSPS